MKVFLSTMWDLYFFWKFDCKCKMTAGEFEVAINKDLAFLFNDGEEMPNLWEAIKELYMNILPIEDYYQCEGKAAFVDKFSKQYNA